MYLFDGIFLHSIKKKKKKEQLAGDRIKSKIYQVDLPTMEQKIQSKKLKLHEI